MRVRFYRLIDLQVGDEFYISGNVPDLEGNVYLAKSRFTVLGTDKSNTNEISRLSLRDEEGRDIIAGFFSKHSKINVRLRDFSLIYKH